MKNNGLLWVTGILLAACGGEPGTALDLEPEPAPVEETVEATEPEGCGMVFSPVPALLEATELAAARWSAATGCDVRVGEGGVPLAAKPLVFAVQDEAGIRVASEPLDGGTQLCGASFGRIGESLTWEMHISTATARCPSTGEIIAHEMGHVLRADNAHVETGLMQSTLYGGPIDAASLELVCGGFPCAGFAPDF